MSLADLQLRKRSPYLDWALDLYVDGKIGSIPKNEEQAKDMLDDLGYTNVPLDYQPGNLGGDL